MAAARLLLVLGHFGGDDLEVGLALAQADQLVDIVENEVLHLVHQLSVHVDLVVVGLALLHPASEEASVQEYDYIALGVADGSFFLVYLGLLCSQLILLEVPLQVRVRLRDGVAPRQAEGENHVVDVLVQGIVHVVVEELLADQFEYLLMMLPIL